MREAAVWRVEWAVAASVEVERAAKRVWVKEVGRVEEAKWATAAPTASAAVAVVARAAAALAVVKAAAALEVGSEEEAMAAVMAAAALEVGSEEEAMAAPATAAATAVEKVVEVMAAAATVEVVRVEEALEAAVTATVAVARVRIMEAAERAKEKVAEAAANLKSRQKKRCRRNQTQSLLSRSLLLHRIQRNNPRLCAARGGQSRGGQAASRGAWR